MESSKSATAAVGTETLDPVAGERAPLVDAQRLAAVAPARPTEYRQDKRTPFVGWSKRIESEGLEFACAGLKFCFFNNG